MAPPCEHLCAPDEPAAAQQGATRPAPATGDELPGAPDSSIDDPPNQRVATSQAPAPAEVAEMLALLTAERARNRQLEHRLLELENAQQQLGRYAADLQRTHAELRRHLSHMATLNEVTRAISAELDLNEVISRALRALASLLPHHAAFVYLIDERGTQATCRASRGEIKPPPPRQISLGEGPVGRALRDGTIVVSETTGFDHGDESKQALAIPLRAHGRALGAIYLIRAAEEKFGQEEQHLVELLAASTAVAMQNALLYRATQWLATTDPLTETANYRRFRESLALEIARARRFKYPVGLLIIDLDRFKRINDLFGHPTGDEVLVAVARTMQGEVRRTDVVARIGGEEFAIILPGCSLAAVGAVGEKIRRAITALPPLYRRGKRRIPITLSIGGSSLRAEEASADTLIQQADQALYRAKQRGRNQVQLWTGEEAESSRDLAGREEPDADQP